jgi:hypothetical protein
MSSEVMQWKNFAFTVDKYSDPKESKTARWEVTNKFGLRIEIYFDSYFGVDKDYNPRISWPTIAPRNVEQSTYFAEMILFACKIAQDAIMLSPEPSESNMSES